MAEFDYAGNGASFPIPKSNTNGSGTATFWSNSFQPVVDRTAWLVLNMSNAIALAKQTASSGDTLIGVLTYVGRFLAIPTGTLRAALSYIADNALTDGASVAITPSASTATMDYAVSRDYHVFSPTAASLVITVKSTSPAPPEGAEINLSAYVLLSGKTVILARENATQIVIMTGGGTGTNFGSACLKNIGGTWRLKTATGLGAAWATTVPGSINSP